MVFSGEAASSVAALASVEAVFYVFFLGVCGGLGGVCFLGWCGCAVGVVLGVVALGVLSPCFSWAVQQKMIPENPFDRIERRRMVRSDAIDIFTPAEAARLLGEAAGSGCVYAGGGAAVDGGGAAFLCNVLLGEV